MAQENTVSFKVFLQKAGTNEKPEVRRFGIDRDVVSNFSYLKEKLQTVFPTLRAKAITVSWKDDEGDDIVISTDDELMIALAEMQSDVRKLYVTVNDGCPKQESSSKSEGRTPHFGVVCDGCDKQVEGFRYKCIQCSNYDLCACCEAKGLHSEHFVIRIPVPVQWRSHFGRRLAHQLYKSSRKSSHCSGAKQTEQEEGQCPFASRSGVHHQGGRPVNWLNTLCGYLNEFANFPGEGESQETPKKTANETGPTGSKEEESHINYLLNVGKTVANILDPLGIDVDVEVQVNNGENKKVRKSNVNKKSMTKEKSSEDLMNTETVPNEVVAETNPAEVHNNETQINQELNDDHTGSNLKSSRSDHEIPEVDGWTVLNEREESQQFQNQGSSSKQSDNTDTVTSNGNEIPVAVQTAAAAAAMARAAASATGAIPKQTYPVFYPPQMPQSVPFGTSQGGVVWNHYPLPANMYPNFHPHQPIAQPIAQPLAQPLVQPPTQPSAPQPLHQNPKIANAVHKMMAMGFSNEGGWLTQLLEIKNGDIDKALDVLQPVKK